MKKTPFFTAIFLLVVFSGSALSGVDTTQVPPMLSCWGIKGLTQTVSAEALGKGRLNVAIQGAWYRQDQTFAGVPNADADIVTGFGAFSFGVSDFVDVFGSVALFSGLGYTASTTSGLGTISAGAQAMLPLPAASPFRLGAQLSVLGGTSQNQINTNNADGYNYFETRDGYDFSGKFIESLVFGSELTAFRLHLNEGLVTSLEKDKNNLLLLAGGVQTTLYRYVVIGLEANSRTSLSDISVRSDPLWLTPSLTFRSPWFFNFCVGSDISLSRDRTGSSAVRALEPFRLFGALAFSVDVLASKRRADAEKQQREAAEKVELEKKNTALSVKADSLARKATEDSLAAAQRQQAERRRSDSLARMADSLVQRSRQDSTLLVDARKRLAEEKSKRSDAEKKLLETGMLILDAVYFESGKTDISINSKPYLKIIGKMLGKYPKLMLEVGGHTDNVGGFDANQQLSQARAESVRNFLCAVAPDLASRLSAMGYGLSVPKADNSTAEGRKQNRRVELKVLNSEVLKEYNQ
jgi:outer membrane protein OmpA-like peptidoglycan-associated protein